MSSAIIRPILRTSISGDVGGVQKSYTTQENPLVTGSRAHRSGQIIDGQCIDGCLRSEEATGRPNGRDGVQRTLGRAAATSLMSPTPPACLRRSHRKKVHRVAVWARPAVMASKSGAEQYLAPRLDIPSEFRGIPAIRSVLDPKGRNRRKNFRGITKNGRKDLPAGFPAGHVGRA